MTIAEVAELLRRCGYHNVWFREEHAAQRGLQRHVSVNDVIEALRNHARLTQQPNERWKAEGPDLDGDDLEVVFVVEADIVIISVF